jgi:hypothetical protein
VVGQAHRLVVQPAVDVALAVRKSRISSRPQRGQWCDGEHDVGVVAEELECLADVLAPDQRVAHLGAAGRVEVVHGVTAVLGHAQPAVVGEEEVHLRRGLGAGRVLEHDAHAVDDHLGAGGGDLDGGRQDGDRAHRRGLAEAAVDVAVGAGGSIIPYM